MKAKDMSCILSSAKLKIKDHQKEWAKRIPSEKESISEGINTWSFHDRIAVWSEKKKTFEVTRP